MSESTVDRDPFEVVAASFLARYRAGERPSIEEYAAKYPELANQIRALLPALVMVEEDLSIDRGSRTGREQPPTQTGHVLETLAQSIGSMPRLVLSDTDPNETGATATVPASGAMHVPVERGGRYELFGEIARGGMGAVLRGRDPDLGRDLAVKVLLESHEDKPEIVRRFVEEAQIGGQLQHPGIVPVYELGAFADRRPYFTMKLVRGRTLSSLLAERQSPAHDLPRFLSIFEAICQTVAYSHARGVIHRDLKPSNVMVGSFGEVQVMDWGLAKVLKEDGLAAEPLARPASGETVVATVRSGSDVDESRAGSVMGTPAYMAPEQAAGSLHRVDRRSDVFGLGAILCEILTGQTAYTGRSVQDVVLKAMRGETADALARLGVCGAETELIALAKDCLAVEPEDRPRDAGAVAGRITAYLAGVQERVQAAERERAVAIAKAIEERRRRKVQLALAASVLAFTTLAGLSTTYYLQQQQAKAAAGQRVVDQVTTLHNQAVAQPEEIERWEVALAAVEQADPAGDSKTRARLLALHEAIRAGWDAARRDEAMLAHLADIRSAEADNPDGSITDRDYAIAFREADIDLDRLRPADAGAKLKARPPSVTLALAGALDDWARIRRVVRKDPAGAARLSEAARVADPDPWRNELRTILDQSEKAVTLAGLQALAKKADFQDLGPISLQLLGGGLLSAGDLTGAELVLRRAQRRHPRDLWINYKLGSVLESLPRADEAIRFYTAAHAIQPATAHALAHALEKQGRSQEAIAVFRDLKERCPGILMNLECLGKLLADKGRSREADEVLEVALAARREAVRQKPDDAHARMHLGNVLKQQGKLDEACAEYRENIRLEPDDALAHHKLGDMLKEQGKLDLAIAAQREAIRRRPDFAEAHSQVGSILVSQGKLDEGLAEFREAIRLKPNDAGIHNNLGAVLCDVKRDFPAAEIEFREAIRLRPHDANTHTNLGTALVQQGERDLAIAEFRESIRLRSDVFRVHEYLGAALNLRGNFEEAIAELREAIRLKPDDAGIHNSLGIILCDLKRDYPAAEAAFREAIRLTPDDGFAYGNLGNALKHQGKLEEAMAAYRESVRLKPDDGGIHNSLGVILCDGKHEYAAAEIEFREAIRLEPDNAAARYHLGIALNAQAKHDEATAEYREAIRLKPDYAEVHVNLGTILCDVRRDHSAAEDAFREAIRLKPDLVEAHLNLGVALRARGRLHEALASYERARELAPPGSEIARELSIWIPGIEKMIASSGLRPAAPTGNAGANTSRDRALLTIGDEAPAISVSQWVKGDPVDRLDPKKTYVVEFWATWCGPCRVSIPHLTELQRRYKDKGVTFVGVSIWEQDQSAVKPFVATMGDQMNYAVAMDEVPKGQKGKMAESWMQAAGQSGIPTAFIVRDGKVAWIGHPMAMDEALERASGKDFDIKVEARHHHEQSLVANARNAEGEVLALLTSAATQAWFRQEKEYSATCDRVLKLANDTKVPTTAERAAKICSLLPSDARTQEAALVLARRAVDLGKGHGALVYFQMAVGMAEYRSGHYAAADAALLAAAELGKNNYYVSCTTAFYRAMSLFRQGKEAEARKLASEAVVKMKPLPVDENHPLAGSDNADDLILWMA